MRDDRRLDVKAGDPKGMIGPGDMQRHAAGAAAKIEDASARDLDPIKHAIDLVGTAGRKIALTPEHLEETDGRIVIFDGMFRILIDR